MMPAAEVIAEFKGVLDSVSAPRHTAIFSQVLDLFLLHAEHYSQEQLALFDDVLVYLMSKASRQTLADLSSRLASINNAPRRVVALLGCHPDISVSAPILEHSFALTDASLAEIAKHAAPQQLMLISARPRLGEATTEALIERNIPDLTRQVLANHQAKLSEVSFARMISSAAADMDLKAAIARRHDLPDELRPWVKDAIAG